MAFAAIRRARVENMKNRPKTGQASSFKFATIACKEKDMKKIIYLLALFVFLPYSA